MEKAAPTIPCARGSCSVLMLMSGKNYVYVVDIVMIFLCPRAYIDCLCCHHHHFKLKLNVTWNTTGPTVQSNHDM